MKKKILALVLTMSLLLTSVCIGVSGAEVADKDLNDVQTTADGSERGGTADRKDTENDVVRIEEYAEWLNLERTKARVDFYIAPKNASPTVLDLPVDVVFIADISDSMEGDRLAQEKAGIKATAQDIINRNNGSRVALVQFGSTASSLCDFTNDLAAFNASVDAMSVDGLTNYGAGFMEAKKLIDARTNTTNAIRVAFISDGLPTAGTATAKSVKSAINAMGGKVYGLQYMLGSAFSADFRAVVDKISLLDSVEGFAEKLRALMVEYDPDSCLNNVVLTDIVSSDFYVTNISNVSVTSGYVSESGNTLKWTIGDLTGSEMFSAELTFAHSDSTEGDFPTNNGKAVLSYTGGSLGVDSPVLDRYRYNVTYTVDAGCGEAPVDSKGYMPGETVTLLDIAEDNPSDDVIFRRWDCTRSDYFPEYPGQTFKMPPVDLEFKSYFCTVPNVELEAKATNPLASGWLPIGDTKFDYKLEGSDTLYIRNRVTDTWATFADSEVNTLKNLHTAGTIDLAQLTTIQFFGKIQEIDMCLFRTNEIDYVEHLDLSEVEVLPEGQTIYGSSFALYCGKGSIPISYTTKVFKGLRYLKSCELPASLTKMWKPNSSKYYVPFAGCSSLETMDLSNITGVTSSLNKGLFAECTSLTSVTFNEDVGYIGDYWFTFCSSLTSIPNADKVTSVEISAFRSCTSLTSAILPNCTRVRISAFESCSKLATLNAPSLTTIEAKAFKNCNLSTAIVSSNTLSIADEAFYNNKNLVSFNESEAKITSLGASVFYNCSSLKTCGVGSNSTFSTLGQSLFENCSSLESFTIPASVTTPWNRVFANCTSLTSITIPETVTTLTVASELFVGCTNLSEVNIEMGKTDSNPFYVTYSMFGKCKALKYIELPPVTTKIEQYGFSESGLEYIDLSMVSDKIGASPFYKCTSLTTVIAPNSSSVFTGGFSNYFSGCTALKNIYGPDYLLTNFSSYYKGLASEAPAYTPSHGTALVNTPADLDVVVNDSKDAAVVTTLDVDRGEGETIEYGQVNEGATIDYTIKIKGPRAPSLESDFKHGVVTIRDELPEGLTLIEDSIQVSQEAVVFGNYDPENPENTTKAHGEIVKQDGKDYSIDSEGAIVVKIVGLDSHGYMIITFQCTVDTLPDGLLHRDFYNSATIQEQNVVKVSNVTYHYVDKNADQDNLPKNVSYQYVGTVPSGVVAPAAASYDVDATVTVENHTPVDGYRFEGWTFYGEDGQVFDSIEAPRGARGAEAGSTFAMPNQNLRAIGTYSANEVPTPTEVVVSYEFTGDVPSAKVGTEPTATTVAYNNTTTIATYPEAVEGYYFQGWTIDGTVYEAGATTPALTKDTVVRGNWVKLATDGQTSGDTPVYYTVTVNYRNAPASMNLTTKTFVYAAGEEVTLPEITGVPSTHIFDGYISDDVYVKDGKFTMPAKDVVATGIFVDASKAIEEEDLTYTVIYANNQNNSGELFYQIDENVESPLTLTSAPITHVYGQNAGLVKDGVPSHNDNNLLFAGWFKTKEASQYSYSNHHVDPTQAFGKEIDLSTCNVLASTDIDGTTYENVVFLYSGFVRTGTVTKDGKDKNNYGDTTLKGFSLEGVQIRSKEVADKYQNGDRNTDKDALRFVTVYRNGMLEELQGLHGESVSYGYRAYAQDNISSLTSLDDKTSGAKDVDCTKEGDHNHRMFGDYRLSTLVIKYDGADSAYMDSLVEARAYVDYTDANGFGRRGYHTYSDSKFAGGCRTSFNATMKAVSNAYDALAKIA
ncbi:MAG: leucine-rich repeat protein [Clostridia bacterium]|nr:leucine-rich repeat protein [Clostridia bacterium]